MKIAVLTHKDVGGYYAAALRERGHEGIIRGGDTMYAQGLKPYLDCDGCLLLEVIQKEHVDFEYLYQPIVTKRHAFSVLKSHPRLFAGFTRGCSGDEANGMGTGAAPGHGTAQAARLGADRRATEAARRPRRRPN
jgi:hypothetical protein